MAIGDAIGEILGHLVVELFSGAFGSLVTTKLTLTIGEDELVVKTRLGSTLVRQRSLVHFTRDTNGEPTLCGLGEPDRKPAKPNQAQVELRELGRPNSLSVADQLALARATLARVDRDSRVRLGSPKKVALRMVVRFEPRLALARDVFAEAASVRSNQALTEQGAGNTSFEFPET